MEEEKLEPGLLQVGRHKSEKVGASRPKSKGKLTDDSLLTTVTPKKLLNPILKSEERMRNDWR